MLIADTPAGEAASASADAHPGSDPAPGPEMLGPDAPAVSPSAV